MVLCRLYSQPTPLLAFFFFFFTCTCQLFFFLLLNTPTSSAHSGVSGQCRVDRRCVCCESSPSIHTELDWLDFSKGFYHRAAHGETHGVCPPSLAHLCNKKHLRRLSINQQAQQPAKQCGVFTGFTGWFNASKFSQPIGNIQRRKHHSQSSFPTVPGESPCNGNMVLHSL